MSIHFRLCSCLGVKSTNGFQKDKRKKYTGFKTYLDAILKALMHSSKHFKWPDCILVSSPNGYRPIARCISRAEEHMWTLFLTIQSQCWIIHLCQLCFLLAIAWRHSMNARLKWMHTSKLSSQWRNISDGVNDYVWALPVATYTLCEAEQWLPNMCVSCSWSFFGSSDEYLHILKLSACELLHMFLNRYKTHSNVFKN